MSRYKSEAEMLRDVIDHTTLTVQDIADELGISTSLLRKYRNGERNPPPEFRLKLAAVLQQHQANVAEWVRKLSS